VRKGTKNGDHGPGQGEPPAALAHAARRTVVFHRYQKHPRRGVVNGVGLVFPEKRKAHGYQKISTWCGYSFASFSCCLSIVNEGFLRHFLALLAECRGHKFLMQGWGRR
jgi:hypothetical protein